MPDLFLYGQTINPIELIIEGTYKLIVFQLYPFVINSFFSVNPADLNDGWYDLTSFKEFNVEQIIKDLHRNANFEYWIETLTGFLNAVFEAKQDKIDFKIQQAL